MGLARLLDGLVYVAVRLFICVVQSLRLETCQRLARGLAYLLNDVLHVRRDVVEDNLRHAYPRLTAGQRQLLSRRMWEHLALMLCEIALATRKIHRTNWQKHITIQQKERVVRTLMDPRPRVMLTGHFGNFELLGFVAGLLGFPTFTIARPLDNRLLDAFLSRHRSATGQYILPTHGSAEIGRQVLEAGETLALLGDQYAGPKGCWVEFFGRPASCHKGVALFSLASGAPLAVLYATRGKRPMQLNVVLKALLDPADDNCPLRTVPELTQWYSRQLEESINRAPEQYWWIHRRWKDTRQPRRPQRAPHGTTASAGNSGP